MSIITVGNEAIKGGVSMEKYGKIILIRKSAFSMQSKVKHHKIQKILSKIEIVQRKNCPK